MIMFLLKLLSLFALCVASSNGARILAVFPGPGYSQFILAEKLLTTLTKRGHEVTVISPFEPKVPPKNYTTVSLRGIVETVFGPSANFFEFVDENVFKLTVDIYLRMGPKMAEYVLSAPQVQSLIHSTKTFDLVIVEQFVSESLFGFAHHFKAPLIVFSSLGACEWTNGLLGNPAIPSYVPHYSIGFSTTMNFFQRMENMFLSLFDSLLREFAIFPEHNKLLKKYFPNAPDINDVIYNISLVLLNSHPAVTDSFHLPANMIEIGGFHVEPEPIPEELKKFLDQSTEGVILFSMGSNLKSKDLSVDTRNQILEVFSKLKQKVLWKFEDENLPGRPKNLQISKWLPQRAVLSHPNTVAFISHCGLLSTTESVFYAVPIVCIPIFADQPMNADMIERNQIGIRLSIMDINRQTFGNALREILDNKIYRNNIKERSKVLRDRPVKPLDLAVYWIEYVLRHRGAPNYRSAALNLKWYQRWMLDILAFIAIVTICSLKILCAGLKRIKATFKKVDKVKKNK